MFLHYLTMCEHRHGVVVSTPIYESAVLNLILAWALGTQLIELFILPLRLVD